MAHIIQIKPPKSASSESKIISSKPKISQKESQDPILTSIGIEYTPTISNDKELVMKILDNNCYLPQNEFIIDFNYEFSKLMELKELKDEGSKGTLLGMAILGVVGFFAFSFTIIGGIAGGVLGIILGRYAGKKILRKAKDKTSLTEFELFTTKLECLLKWMKLEKKKSQFNINNYRLVIEKVVQSFKMAFFFEGVQNKSQRKILVHLIKKLKKELLTSRNLTTLYLSYKLFKEFKRRHPTQNNTIAEILNNVFVPLLKILTFQNEKKTTSKYDLLKKLKKLLKDSAIEEIMNAHPDAEVSSECQKIFIGNLNVKINITKTMLEFFGSNNFLETLLHSEKENLEMLQLNNTEKLFLNKSNNQMMDSKPSSDPILENFLQNYNDNPLQPQNRLKTIVSESNSSAFSISDEEVIQPMPKNFIAKNQLNGDKKLTLAPFKNKENEYQIVIGIPEKADDSEEKKMNSMGIDQSERSGSSSSINLNKKALDYLINNNINDIVPANQSFAMNRRGEEFLKMPSLNVLSDEEKKKKRKHSNVLQTHEDKPNDQHKLGCLGKQQTLLEKVDTNPKKEDSERNIVMSKKIPSNSLDMNIESNFNLLTNYVNEEVSTWDKVSMSKFLHVHRRKVAGSPCVLIKAKAWLEGIHKQTVFDQIYIIEKRKKWDTVFGEFKQIEQIDEVTDVIYFLINSPFGVMNRDFVQRRVFRYDYPEKGSLCIQFKSIEHPMMPIKKNCIRAETFISGYIISTDPNNKESSILQLVTQVDVKGSIPKSIVNYTASKAPIDWVNNLKKACLKN